MRLSDIMSEAVETIGPGATAEEARRLMRQKEVRHLVVMERGAVAGVLTQHALMHADAAAPVRRLMSAPVVIATPHATVRQAANLMRGNHVGCLPVLDGGRLAGMVTDADLLDLIGKGVSREPEIQGRPQRSWTPGR